MKKVMTLIRLSAGGFGAAAVLYLSNQGELGVNMTTIMATASPIVLIIVTYMFEALRYILPTAIVRVVFNFAQKRFGNEHTKQLVELVNSIAPQEVVNKVTEFMSEFVDLKNTVTLIKERQENVM